MLSGSDALHIPPVTGPFLFATIHAALDAGIDLIETGDFYGSGHN
jgi:aryl-alcohol dehydrogenase-like predicted oxidoreductase